MRHCTAFCIAASLFMAFITMSPAVGDEPRQPSPVPARRTPYVLNRGTFAPELAAAKSETEKLGVLAKRWELVKLAVAHCSVTTGPASFHRSVRFWQSGYVGSDSEKITIDQNLEKPVNAEKDTTLLIRGDCLADVTIKSSALIHVYGDLRAKITASGDAQCEIVIGGAIAQNAGIEGDGIQTIFVGASVDGYIREQGSSHTWINGDLRGEIGAGSPLAALHVMGDFNGSMKPLGKPALAYIDVRGFMSSAAIKTIADQGYTELQASIGLSDQAAGLYPQQGGPPERLWVIHGKRD